MASNPRLRIKTVTIFGSSLPGEGSATYAEARTLGTLLAEAGYAVCNGGYGGLMEATARGARQAGGHTIGVTCEIWESKPNRWIIEEVRTQSFAERIMELISRGDAYIVLPGGTGTLAEFALTWEMMNKESLAAASGGRKPVLALGSYWNPVIDCLKQEQSLAVPPIRKPPAALEMVTVVQRLEDVTQFLEKAVL